MEDNATIGVEEDEVEGASLGVGVCVDVRRALSAGARGRPFATGLKTVPPFSAMRLVETTCRSNKHSRTRVDIVLQLIPLLS